MAHFAKIENGIVTMVIVAEQEYIDSLSEKEFYIQTSYNTYQGVHNLGGTPLRKNFAGIGFTYDKIRDAFIPPKPLSYPSWVLDEEKCIWVPPIPYPDDENPYKWNEETQNWDIIDSYETSPINPE